MRLKKPAGGYYARPQRDGKEVWAPSDTVSAIDTATHMVVGVVPTGRDPFTMLLNVDDTDVPSLTVSATIPDPGAVAWQSD